MTNEYNFENVNVEYLHDNSNDEYVLENHNNDNEVIHDDGCMSIMYNGVQYCFNVGQEVSSSVYNRECNQILNQSGITGPRVTGNNN